MPYTCAHITVKYIYTYTYTFIRSLLGSSHAITILWAMKRKSPATEQAAKKHNSAKRGRATEHATSGSATDDADIKDSCGPGKDGCWWA